MKFKSFLLILIIQLFTFPSYCQEIIFSDSVQMEHCGHGFYIIKKDRTFYKKDIPMISSIAVTRPEPFDCDISSFEILKNGYAKDKYNIFYNGVKLNNADYNSFSVLEIDHSYLKDWREEPLSNIYGYYAKDKYQVFYGERILKDVDPETIEMLSLKYLKDKKHAYIKGEIIENADANSFTFIGGRFAKDKNHVYHIGKVISDNPSSFQIVDYQYRYAKDGNYAYHWHGNHPIHIDTIVEVNVDKFKPLTNFRATDGERMYWFGHFIPSADVATFEVINKDYSCDKNHVYYRYKKISGADPESFVLLNHYWGKDKNYIFFMEIKREDTDYKTFVIEDQPRDKNYIYDYSGKRIKEVGKD